MLKINGYITMLKINGYITIKEAAEILGVSRQTLRNWDNLGKLKTFRHTASKYRLYKKEDLYDILESIANSSGDKITKEMVEKT